MTRRLLVVALLGTTTLVAGCTSKAGTKIHVTATDSSCDPATSALDAGKTTFSVTNKGSKETEMYVLQGSKTLGEVEDIGPGTSRDLTVSLKAGDYDLNCKPGQKGDGIKTPIKVSGTSTSTP